MTALSSSRPRARRLSSTSAALAAALTLSACAGLPGQGEGGGIFSSYTSSCLTMGLVGAALQATLDRNKTKPVAERQADLAKAAAAGCALGLAATAVGKMMDARQRETHEAEMQKEARRRALEQQQYAATVQRLQTQPAATPQQRSARDAELARARAAYQESLSRPVEVNLGNGGTSTIQVQAPATAAPGAAPGAAPAATCTEYAVLVRTPAGQARQFETWCPNAGGQMVRTDVRPAPAA